MTTPESSRWVARWGGWLILAVAFVIRLLYFFDIRANPFFDAPVIDAEFYDQLGRALAGGEGTGRAPFMMPPLFPMVLALLYSVAGPERLLAHVLQLALGCVSSLLAFRIGQRMGGSLVGLVAGLVVATSKALLFLEADLLATPLVVCLDLLVLWLLLRAVQEGGHRLEVWLAGLAAGCSALARPSILVFVAPLLLWLAWRRRTALILPFVVSLFLPILPVTLHNYRASGEFVLVSANGGINFYMGNNPEMRTTSRLRPGPEWRRMNDIPLREAGLSRAGERDRYFYAKGLRFWTEQPVRALSTTFEKFVQLFHNHEMMRDVDFYFFAREYSRLLRLPGWNFAFLCSLAVVGLVFARRRTPAEEILLLFFVSYSLGIVLFFVTARYRAPLLPVLGVFAGLGLQWLLDHFRQRQWRSLAIALSVCASLYALSIVDFHAQDNVDEVEARYRVATTFEKKSNFEEAVRRYDGVLALDPGHALAAARAAVCLQQLGRVQEAVNRYEKLLERHPDYVEPMVNLANIAWRFEDPVSAEHYFELAIRSDPIYAQAYGYYGMFLLAQGKTQRAVSHLSRALELDASWLQLQVELARALLIQGDASGALQEIEAASRILPPSAAIELLRGDILQRLGRVADARRAWENGLRLDPASPELRDRLSKQSER